MGEKEWDPVDVFDVFGDSLARRILVIASDRDVTAQELSEQLDVSTPTVYRRLKELREYDLVAERNQIDGDGNHYKTIETSLRRISLEIEDGGYTIDLELRQSLADQFESFWTDLNESNAGHGGDTDRRPDPGRFQT